MTVKLSNLRENLPHTLRLLEKSMIGAFNMMESNGFVDLEDGEPSVAVVFTDKESGEKIRFYLGVKFAADTTEDDEDED